MIPIPDYLNNIAEFEKSTGNWVTFSLRCSCGCRTFLVYENCLTQEEQRLTAPYWDALRSLCAYPSTMTVDGDGTRHYWRILSRDGLEREEVILPPEPVCACVSTVKVGCSACGREYMVFDSRLHGYDGMTSEKSKEELEYQPQFRQKCRAPVAIRIKVENDVSLEEFNANTSLNFDEKAYSNAFSWIAIYNRDKKRKLFEFETA